MGVFRAKMMRGVLLASSGAMAASFAGAAVAQQAEQRSSLTVDPIASDGQSDQSVEDIIVTGTLIRGAAPVGTNVVGLSSADIVNTGATNTNQVLARIPQVSSAFNQLPALSSTGAARQSVRPSLRNLGAQGGSTTLILIDGHRAVGVGTIESTADPDVIPPGLLERVDVVLDGGSSLYGSDAVGGVINFITRSRFSGLEASARVGSADNYRTVDANVIAGRDWDAGSAFISYAYAHHDALFGRDRDFVRQVSASTGFCAPGTVNITRANATTSYALPGRVPGTASRCDATDNASFYPSETRHSVFAGLTQDLSETLRIDMKAFYTDRKSIVYYDLNQTNSTFGISGQSATISAVNPYYSPIAPDTGVQTVQFSYAGAFDPRARTTLSEWGVVPTLTFKPGGDWQVRLLGNYGRSFTEARSPQIDATSQAIALGSATLATALNPYNPADSNPAVLASIFRYDYGDSKQELINSRMVADGTLFALPGGNVRAAVGLEYIRESYSGRFGPVIPGQERSAPLGVAVRNVKSAFGELVIPLIGTDNSMPLIRSLSLSASARYDEYSDFGDTFNPKIGATYKPLDWMTIRGNYGTSFNAPSLADAGGSPDTRAQILPVSPFRDPADAAANFFRPSILLAGGNPDLGPQKADTWSVGVDIRPVRGFTASLTYYNISVRDSIGLAPFFAPAIFQPEYAEFFTKNPTLAQLTSIVGGLRLDGATSLASLYGASTPYVIIDARRQNLGEIRQDGLDFNVAYNQPMSFGSINATVGGTYTLNRSLAAIAGAPFVDQFASPGASRFSVLGTLGGTVGRVNGTATLSHSEGYRIPQSLTGLTKVGSFDTVDLYLAYDMKGSGLAKDLSFTLNVNNVFDADPPLGPIDPGYANGATLGRLFQAGIRKKF